MLYDDSRNPAHSGAVDNSVVIRNRTIRINATVRRVFRLDATVFQTQRDQFVENLLSQLIAFYVSFVIQIAGPIGNPHFGSVYADATRIAM